MKVKFFSLLLVLLIFSPLQSVKAVVMDELYTVALPVSDQTTDLRLGAFEAAFGLVLTKVSGSDEAQKNTAIMRLAKNSSRYVKQFSYEDRPGVDAEGGTIKLLYLKINFDQQLIERLLRKHNFPVWGRERPSSFLVINSQSSSAIQIVTGDSEPKVVELIYAAALKMGVPTLLPLMDLEDISLIDVSDVTLRDFTVINNMATRYGPDAVVVGEIVELDSDNWQGAWEVRFGDQIFKWQHKASTQAAVIDELIAHLAKVLALEYALEYHQSNEQELLLKVSSILDINHLISVQKYLGSLNVVESVRVALVAKEEVTFYLKLRNSAEDLQRLIDIGNVLEQQGLPQVNLQSNGGVVISYDFIGRGISN
ncbi:MAG: hypothetical protein ACI9YO_000380 [Gammaproteobacteria bacterium]|jgi:hypothetical protein